MPQTPNALADAIAGEIRRRVQAPADGPRVAAEGDGLAHGRRLDVDVTGCRLQMTSEAEELQFPKLHDSREPGPAFEATHVTARPMVFVAADGSEVPVTVDVRGEKVAFELRPTHRDTIAMIPAGGTITADVSVPQSQFVAAFAAQARFEAAKQGANVDRVDLRAETPDDRTVVVRGRVEGSKKVAFFNARFAVNVHALATIEADGDRLVARVRELDLTGDGPVVSALLGFVKPKIDKIKATPIELGQALAAAGVGGLAIRDVRVNGGDTLSLHVEASDRA